MYCGIALKLNGFYKFQEMGIPLNLNGVTFILSNFPQATPNILPVL